MTPPSSFALAVACERCGLRGGGSSGTGLTSTSRYGGPDRGASAEQRDCSDDHRGDRAPAPGIGCSPVHGTHTIILPG
jgi:hypothetical protein